MTVHLHIRASEFGVQSLHTYTGSHLWWHVAIQSIAYCQDLNLEAGSFVVDYCSFNNSAGQIEQGDGVAINIHKCSSVAKVEILIKHPSTFWHTCKVLYPWAICCDTMVYCELFVSNMQYEFAFRTASDRKLGEV